MFSDSSIKTFFDIALAGESKTYNDHNWYTNSGLKGYIEGRGNSAYPLLSKDLTKLTIGEVKALQSNQRDSNGQLWATGRYQIIPNTLIGSVKKAGLSDNDLYNEKNQDKLGLSLLDARSSIRKYIRQEIPDTKENLESASLSMAKIWSSIGVPYPLQGRNKFVDKNQSYYAGGGDKASETTEAVQSALKKLRESFGKKDTLVKSKSNLMKGIGYGLIMISVVGFAYSLYYFTKTKK